MCFNSVLELLLQFHRTIWGDIPSILASCIYKNDDKTYLIVSTEEHIYIIDIYNPQEYIIFYYVELDQIDDMYNDREPDMLLNEQYHYFINQMVIVDNTLICYSIEGKVYTYNIDKLISMGLKSDAITVVNSLSYFNEERGHIDINFCSSSEQKEMNYHQYFSPVEKKRLISVLPNLKRVGSIKCFNSRFEKFGLILNKNFILKKSSDHILKYVQPEHRDKFNVYTQHHTGDMIVCCNGRRNPLYFYTNMYSREKVTLSIPINNNDLSKIIASYVPPKYRLGFIDDCSMPDSIINNMFFDKDIFIVLYTNGVIEYWHIPVKYLLFIVDQKK